MDTTPYELFDKLDSPSEQDAIKAMLEIAEKIGGFHNFARKLELSPLLIRPTICDAIKLMDGNTLEERINAFLSARDAIRSDRLSWGTIARALKYHSDVDAKLEHARQSIHHLDSQRDEAATNISEISMRLDEQKWDVDALQTAKRKLGENLNSLQSDHDSLQKTHDGLQENHDEMRKEFDELQGKVNELWGARLKEMRHPRPLRTILIFAILIVIATLVALMRGDH
jgi:predicted RNase H-like nuclease (RuvC/YqgF family)